MRGRAWESTWAGAIAAATTVGFAAFAHASAGGRVDLSVAAIALCVGIVLATAIASRVRLTFWRAVILSLAAQPLLHLAFEHRGHHEPMMGDHAMGGHHDAMATVGSGGHMGMLVAHMAVALVTAVVLRWGLRWLRSMPALARALVLVEQRVISPASMSAGRLPTLAGVAATPIEWPRSWDNRGPPE